MKILRRFLYFLLVLSILITGLIMICALNPGVTRAIAGVLYPDRSAGSDQAVSAQADPESAQVPLPEETPEELSSELPDPLPDELQTEAYEDAGKRIGQSSDYIPPEQSSIVIPEEVSGRNGYQQVEEKQEQIDEGRAEELRQLLDTGHTGDGSEFDARFYPYYAMLDAKEQHLYRQIYANGSACYQAFAPVESVTPQELRNVFIAVYNDHPELFWLETAYTGKYDRSGQCVEIDLRFNRTFTDLDAEKAVFDDHVDRILAEAQGLSGNYEKEKFVHDALLGQTAYDLRAEMNQSAYSALVNGQAVCAGYARAFQYLMQQLGIPCYYCTGFAGESHAWNIVMLEDGFYNVDATWDDTDTGTYDYFNKTDSDYASTHIRQELSVYLPPCNGQAYRDRDLNRNQDQEPESGSETRESGLENIEEGNLRSLEETGVTDAKIFTDMERYYADCRERILQQGKGTYSFYSVIEGDNLFKEWYEHYQNSDYRQAYLEDAIAQMGASSCRITVEVEHLQGSQYLIRHDLDIQ